MLDLAAIILTKDEKLHIRRCLERLMPLEPRQIFIVDSFSTDGTQKIVEELASGGVDELSGRGAELDNGQTHKLTNSQTRKLFLVEHEWPGNQAAQFQWALDNLPIEAKWILRLDADEYLTDELIAEIRTKLPQMDDDVDGVVLKRRHVVGWLGNRWVKRGMYPSKILRLFRRGYGRSDMKVMDEHIVVQRRVIEFEHDFVDHSLISFEEWKEKHRNYAKREAQSYLSGERSTGEKAAKKDAYYKLPPYFRALAYFILRYFVKLGFLEGLHALCWHFWQGLWYRCLVDREIGRMKRERKVKVKKLGEGEEG